MKHIIIVCAVLVAGTLFAASDRQIYRDAQGLNMGSSSTGGKRRMGAFSPPLCDCRHLWRVYDFLDLLERDV